MEQALGGSSMNGLQFAERSATSHVDRGLTAVDVARIPSSLDAAQLRAYFALMDVAGLLKHAVEQQRREVGDLSYVQFQLLTSLGLDSPTCSKRMTDLADGVVYSRSGLTYQAGLLEKAGLVTRAPSEDDDRGVTVTITAAGRKRLAKVLPGHTEVISQQLFQPLSATDATNLADLLAPVRDHMRAAPPRSAAPRRKR